LKEKGEEESCERVNGVEQRPEDEQFVLFLLKKWHQLRRENVPRGPVSGISRNRIFQNAQYTFYFSYSAGTMILAPPPTIE
jgi:hypothetical protein